MMSKTYLRELVERADSAPDVCGVLLDEIAAAVDASASDPQLAYWHGVLLYNYYKELGREDRSIEAFERALAVDPSNVDARYLLGCAFFDLGNFERSLECMSAVLRDVRLVAPLQRWRWLKATELVGIAKVRLGQVGLDTMVASYYDVFAETEEEDRPRPCELVSLVEEMGFPKLPEYAALWE